MAGVKGRSGRQKAPFQEQRQRVIDKAWEIAEQILNDPRSPLQLKVDIAKSIIVKNIPQEMQHSGDINLSFSTNGSLLSKAEREYASSN